MILYEAFQERQPNLPDFKTLDERVQRRLIFIFASYERFAQLNRNVTKKSKQKNVKKQLAKYIDEFKELALSAKKQTEYVKLVKRQEESREHNRIYHQSKQYGL